MADLSLDHLAIVVDDLDAALRFWRDCVGLRPAGAPHDVADEAVTVAFMQLGQARLELIQPTSDDSGVARFLERRGPGLHHLCLRVPDLDAKLRQLAASGVELINDVPRERDGQRYAFVHPASAGGVLLEVYEGAE